MQSGINIKTAGILAGLGLLTAFTLSGCGLLMPYSSNYSCPEAKSGMGNCSSLVTNYKASINPALIKKTAAKNTNCPVSLRGTKACGDINSNIAKTVLKGKNNTAVFNESMPVSQYLLKYMLKTSTPPLYIPAVIKKIWILPYSSKTVFHSGQDIFVVVRKGKWLYGNYLFKKYNKNTLNMFHIRR
ncbi:MAG: TraV family lipoprotein [bacterium]